MRRIFLQAAVFGLTVISLSISQARSNWTANEVSILLPIPREDELKLAIRVPELISHDQWKRATSPGARDVPRNFNTTFFYNSHVDRVANTDIESTYLVAIRIDPCFRDTCSVKCRRQMRLVWQPLGKNGAAIEALDAAGHSFHDLDEERFQTLLKEISSLNRDYEILLNKTRTLQTHPVLARDRYNSSYFRRLREIILDTVKQSFLSRIAVMELHELGEFWEFQAADFLRDGRTQYVKIPNFVSAMNRIVVSNAFQNPTESIRQASESKADYRILIAKRRELVGRFGFKGAVGHLFDVKPGDVDYDSSKAFFVSPIALYLKDSETFPKETLPRLRSTLAEIENPSKHLTGSIDCVSCHATEPIRAFQRGDLDGAKSFHAFGFFKERPSISQRTKNETAQIVRYLNSNAN